MRVSSLHALVQSCVGPEFGPTDSDCAGRGLDRAPQMQLPPSFMQFHLMLKDRIVCSSLRGGGGELDNLKP